MSSIKKLFSLALFTGVMLTPNFALAQSFSIFNESRDCKSGICNLCDLLVIIQNTVNYTLLLLIPIAAIFIIYGGYQIMTAGANPNGIKAGRSTMLTTVVGVAIVFGAWLIVNTVITYLAVGYFQAPWYKISCDSGVAAAPPPAPPAPPPPTAPPPTALKCSADKNSPELDVVINCVKFKANAAGLSLTGQITTYQGGHTCKPPPPAIPTNISCHYGGTGCNGTAHAADFPLVPAQRNPANWAKLRDIGASCQTSASRCEKGTDPYITTCSDPAVNHIHVNDSVSCGCN